MEVRRIGDVEVRIRESTRARRARAVYRYGQMPELVVPAGVSERTIRRHLNLHAGWLARQVARAPKPSLALESVCVTEDEARYEAYERVVPIAEREAERLGVGFRRVVVRDQRSRWGSCSANETLSFNWRLVLAPPDVLDYVVAHEVCHLRECNHSERFWALLESIRPRYREQRDWLGRHGWELLAYRPA
jgi:predicted metal-dependent hydrolase